MQNLYFYLGIYIITLLGISFYFSQKNSKEDFLIAGRNRKSWQIMASKFAASAGVSWFISYTAYTYQYGFSVLSLIPGFLFSYLFFASWAVPRIYQESQEKKFYTQGDFVLSKTNSQLNKKVIDIFGILITFFWLLISLIGGAKVISFLNIMSYEGALVIISSVILIYILASGFKAVIITDIIQSLIIVILFGFAIFNLFQLSDLIVVLSEKTADMKFMQIFGFLIYGIFSYFATPDRYQITFSAENVKEAKTGMGMAVIPVILIFTMITLIGLYVHSVNPNLDPDLAFIKFFFEYLPVTFVPLGLILFLAGLMSSADTNIFVITSYFAFLKNKTGNKIKQIRIYTLILILLTTVIAYVVRDVTKATIFAAGFNLIPAIAMIYVIANGKSAKKFMGIVTGGFIGFVVGLIVIGLDPSTAIFPLLFSLFGFVCVVDSKF